MPALAIVTKDGSALSPARATLAQLLHRKAQLQAEAEPSNARLHRVDGVIAEAARAAQRVAALSAAHQSRFAESIAAGDPPPAKSHELLRAEAAALEAEEASAAAEGARDAVAAVVEAINQQLSLVGREIEDAVAAVAVEATLDYARGAYSAAFRSANAAAASIDGL